MEDTTMQGRCEHPKHVGNHKMNLYWHSTKLYAKDLEASHGDYFRSCGPCCERDYEEFPYEGRHLTQE